MISPNAGSPARSRSDARIAPPTANDAISKRCVSCSMWLTDVTDMCLTVHEQQVFLTRRFGLNELKIPLQKLASTI